MLKTVSFSLGLAAAAWITPLQGQDYSKFAFHVGGGITTPLNPTGQFVGISGHFATGAGYNINRHNTIFGEFLWSNLSPNGRIFPTFRSPDVSANVYTLTANYRYRRDNLGGSIFGLYTIMGGGWYYRTIDIDRSFFVPPGTVCAPIFAWWGFGCNAAGFATDRVFDRNSSAGGLNGGVGFTLKLSDSGWRFFTEARYNYAWTSRVATTFIPVTFGIRYN